MKRRKWLEHYILDDKGRPVAVDLLTWAKWFGTRKRVLKQQDVGHIWVSTIFLGIDHSFTEEGPPVLWETMAFKPTKRTIRIGDKVYPMYRETVAQDQCAGSKEQAEAMHARMVAKMRKRGKRKTKRRPLPGALARRVRRV